LTHNGIDIDQFILLTIYPTITLFVVGIVAIDLLAWYTTCKRKGLVRPGKHLTFEDSEKWLVSFI
jgi:hypothetical protein